ncbi:fibrinogen and fibronectin [Culex quinquefasciatus]|uniref:Fibrinogen and fibronectin n=1 Tax=Culex quinquefasciatus TaxID=7176 RepID=B0WNE1_CULQU|nr:fibrinogen and fibronectin [Culex quinquefasciatus]|eukprot:XP_001850225.1 fibrinogen and fibronectin [Culex quinquefasciatus]
MAWSCSFSLAKECPYASHAGPYNRSSVVAFDRPWPIDMMLGRATSTVSAFVVLLVLCMTLRESHGIKHLNDLIANLNRTCASLEKW